MNISNHKNFVLCGNNLYMLLDGGLFFCCKVESGVSVEAARNSYLHSEISTDELY